LRTQDWQDMPVVRTTDPSRPEKLDADEGRDVRKHRYTAQATRVDAPSNATGMHIESAAKAGDWREKAGMDERDYTRLELDDDREFAWSRVHPGWS
jgi:hypothetical protein